MRKSTRGLITACAGLAAGAAFGAAPALADPGWWPPGHVLGYYNTFGDCGGYANSLSLFNDDYDCDYLPQRVGQPYVLVIQRPVQIAQPVVDYEPAPVMEEPAPVVDEPAPVVDEPTGDALSEEPVKKHKAHKANKAHKATKAHKADKNYRAQNQGQIMADEPVGEAPIADAPCVNVVPTCGNSVDVLAVPVSGPYIGAYGGVYGGAYGGLYDGPFHHGHGHHPWR